VRYMGGNLMGKCAAAFARGGHFDAKLMDKLAASAYQRFDILNAPQSIDVLWSLATFRHMHEEFIEAVAESAAEDIGQHSPADIVRLAWSVARLGYQDERLNEAIRKATTWKIKELTPSEIGQVVQSFEQLDTSPSQSFCKFASRRVVAETGGFDAQAIGALTLACGPMQAAAEAADADAVVDPGFVLSVEKHALSDIRSYSIEDLGNLLTGLGRMRAGSPALREAAAEELVAKLGRAGAEEKAEAVRHLAQLRVPLPAGAATSLEAAAAEVGLSLQAESPEGM